MMQTWLWSRKYNGGTIQQGASDVQNININANIEEGTVK
jgi:hypothetical protein